jgi:hypothetical protein
MSNIIVVPLPKSVAVPAADRWTPDRWFFTSMAVAFVGGASAWLTFARWLTS